MSLSYNQKYRRKHKRRLKAKDEAYYAKNSEHVKSRQMRNYWSLVATPLGRVAHILRGVKVRAKRNKVEFSVTISDLLPLPDVCPILGIKLNYGACRREKGYHKDSPSIDRKNPGMGYVPGNVWIISARANTVKNDGTSAEHRAISEAMERA